MKWKLLSVIFCLLLLPLAFAEEVVQVQSQSTAPVESHWYDFLKNPTLWYTVGIVILITIIVVCLIFLIKWLINYLKSRSNIYFQLRKQRLKLAKVHSRYPSSNHYFKIEKNIPIRLINKDDNGKPSISDPIAYYKGDYTSHEGNVIVSMNMRFNKRLFFFPIGDILIIPNKEKIILHQKQRSGSLKTEVLTNIPLAKDIILFKEKEIFLYAESISNIGGKGNEFYVPVLKAKDGKIIDLSLPTYQSLKEVVVGDYLLEQTDEFVKVSKKTMDLNPNLKYQVKLNDASSNVEVPQENP